MTLRLKPLHWAGLAGVAALIAAGGLYAAAHSAFSAALAIGSRYDQQSASSRQLSVEAMAKFHECKVKSEHTDGSQSVSDIGEFADCFSPLAIAAHPASMAPSIILLGVVGADSQAMASRQPLLAPLSASLEDGFAAELSPAARFDAAMRANCADAVAAWGCRRALPSVFEQQKDGSWAFVPRTRLLLKAAGEADIAFWQASHPVPAARYGAQLVVARLRPGAPLQELEGSPPWLADVAASAARRQAQIDKAIAEAAPAR
jgi:hypothetical protein